MIKCHLSTIMGSKKLKVSDVVRASGINRNTITRLYHETNNRIDFDTLDILCKYLNCTVGELLERVDESDLAEK
ncbi:helix-turn-helix domain-containing protein [Vibrio artabrorum]|uniref:Helix-turn-helix transcriptional regulator n=1 Tax=Vibrio artabrorum TaxID=446374 RepID=A0ABT8CN16_9VIBR|nr:helix-turn-helix transcriptional regulator [Vibrio artabrorum]MDN3702297.1 helix-turn-helix transcriptional regulator [Vibrio artabrorum]